MLALHIIDKHDPQIFNTRLQFDTNVTLESYLFILAVRRPIGL